MLNSFRAFFRRRVGEFLVAPVAAASVDEFLGGGEASLGRFPRERLLAEEKTGAVQLDGGREVQPHGAVLYTAIRQHPRAALLWLRLRRAVKFPD